MQIWCSPVRVKQLNMWTLNKSRVIRQVQKDPMLFGNCFWSEVPPSNPSTLTLQTFRSFKLHPSLENAREYHTKQIQWLISIRPQAEKRKSKNVFEIPYWYKVQSNSSDSLTFSKCSKARAIEPNNICLRKKRELIQSRKQIYWVSLSLKINYRDLGIK